jgi:hypothetical protein
MMEKGTARPRIFLHSLGNMKGLDLGRFDRFKPFLAARRRALEIGSAQEHPQDGMPHRFGPPREPWDNAPEYPTASELRRFDKESALHADLAIVLAAIFGILQTVDGDKRSRGNFSIHLSMYFGWLTDVM